MMADLKTYIVELLNFHSKSDVQNFEYRLVQRLKRVMIQQNTPTNELIEVIQEKSHKFTVGFPFNTRVTTLNHSV